VIKIKKLMDCPAVSSAPTAEEDLARIWLDVQGYITTSGLWFYAHQHGKVASAHRDIDVIGIKDKETAIIDVTTNLNDKIHLTRLGGESDDFRKTIGHFSLVREYLKNVHEYHWLVGKRKIRYIIFYYYSGKISDQCKSLCSKHNIELVGCKRAIGDIKRYLKDNFYTDGKIRSPHTRSSVFAYLKAQTWFEIKGQKESYHVQGGNDG